MRSLARKASVRGGSNGSLARSRRWSGSKDPYALRRAALGVIRVVLDRGVKISLRSLVEKHFENSYATKYLAAADKIDDLMLFFEDRLKVQLREQKARHDLVDAVLSTESLLRGHALISIVDRVDALGKFLDTDDGKNLLAGTKRASNILGIEEKKDKRSFDGPPDA